MAKRPTVEERAADLALTALAEMPARDWRRLADLAQRHTTGRLSADAWQNATGTIVLAALKEAERSEPLDLGAP